VSFTDPAYDAVVERAVLVAVEAFDLNCPQHIAMWLGVFQPFFDASAFICRAFALPLLFPLAPVFSFLTLSRGSSQLPVSFFCLPALALSCLLCVCFHDEEGIITTDREHNEHRDRQPNAHAPNPIPSELPDSP